MEKQLTVGRLGKMTGLSAKSIRYYEREKLIPRANRSPAGYRLYPQSIVSRLRFIQKAKAIGFTLDEVRKMLELTRHGKSCCDQVYAWSEKRLSALDGQIRFLQELRERIIEFQKTWKEKRHEIAFSEAEICTLIENANLPDSALGSDKKTTQIQRARS